MISILRREWIPAGDNLVIGNNLVGKDATSTARRRTTLPGIT
jgi:hypothetical protein